MDGVEWLAIRSRPAQSSLLERNVVSGIHVAEKQSERLNESRTSRS